MSLRNITLLLIGFFGLNISVLAQETTSTLSGIVSDTKGDLVPGATVVVKHEPTGFSTTTQTNNKGIFVVPNLKPGGPYTVVVSFVGFDEQKFENINLILGNNPEIQ